MQLPADITDQLAGYDIERIIAVTIAQAGCCEHGVSLLAPCEPCERVDMLAGHFVRLTVTEDGDGSRGLGE